MISRVSFACFPESPDCEMTLVRDMFEIVGLLTNELRTETTQRLLSPPRCRAVRRLPQLLLLLRRESRKASSSPTSSALGYCGAEGCVACRP